jgi:alpha-L-rhamnosidase
VLQLVPRQGGDVTLRITRDVTAADGQLTLTAGDGRAELALTAIDDLVRAATMSASSTYPGFPVTTLNDGDTSTAAWCSGQTGHGWNDATAGAFPDEVTATLPGTVDVGRVVVQTLSLTNCPYGGIRDFDVQVDTGGAWQTVGSVRGNGAERVEVTFPQVPAVALRLVILDSTTHDYSRIVEVEAYRD